MLFPSVSEVAAVSQLPGALLQTLVAQQVSARFTDQGGSRWPSACCRVAVVGNEDGAHHVAAELFQALNDVGFTIPAGGMTYWVGEAMHETDYKDLPSGSTKTAQATRTAAANAAHLAQLLADTPYPALSF